MQWGRRIKECREARGLTQAQLGQLIGASQQTIAGYESEGDPKEPSIAVFVRLGQELKASPAWLAFGTGDRSVDAKTPTNTAIDRHLMEATVIEYERFVSKKGIGREAISPEKKANMLLFAYDLAEQIGGADKLESAFERLFALATKS